MRTAQSACPAGTRGNKYPSPRILPSVRALLWVSVVVVAFGSTPRAAASQETLATSLLATPARNWAVDCANNEILVIQHPGSFLRYRLHVVDEKGDQVR